MLTLNSCPIYTYYEKDSYRMPEPIKAHFPVPIDINDYELTPNETYKNNNTVIILNIIISYLNIID